MRTLPLTEAKTRLNELIDSAVKTHDRVTITRRGKPAVVLISVDDLEALEETIHWQSQQGVHDDIVQARQEAADGRLGTRRRSAAGMAWLAGELDRHPVQQCDTRPGPAAAAGAACRCRVRVWPFGGQSQACRKAPSGQPRRSVVRKARAYRVLYELDESAERVVVVRVDHRADVYWRR